MEMSFMWKESSFASLGGGQVGGFASTCPLPSAGRSWRSSAAICRALPTVRRAPRSWGRGCLGTHHHAFLVTGWLAGNVQIILPSKRCMRVSPGHVGSALTAVLRKDFHVRGPCGASKDTLSSLTSSTLQTPSFCWYVFGSCHHIHRGAIPLAVEISR